MAKALKPSGTILVSFPLHPKLFNAYDKAVGHERRYVVDSLEKMFRDCGLVIEQYAPMNISWPRSEEHTSELQSLAYLVCRLLLEKKKKKI